MSGDLLLQQLLALSPEQRKLEVLTRADDVGGHRKTVYNPCASIRVRSVPADDEDDSKTMTALVISWGG